jgi:hypothetical protein
VACGGACEQAVASADKPKVTQWMALLLTKADIA